MNNTPLCREMLGMVSSVQQYSPGTKIIVWDLGLKNQHVTKVSMLALHQTLKIFLWYFGWLEIYSLCLTCHLLLVTYVTSSTT